MLKTSPVTGYSADVQIDLFIRGQCFSVGQVGRGMLIFDEPMTLPATEGELVLTIDGHQHKWEVSIEPGQQSQRIIRASLRELA